MMKDLIQKGMINIFAENTKGDFYWWLKILKLFAIRNPENGIVNTTWHKRVSPISATAGWEFEYEILTFLAVILSKLTSHFQWATLILVFCEKGKSYYQFKFIYFQHFDIQQ